MKSIKNWKSPNFDNNNMTKWNWMCTHNKNLKIGKYVDIGAFTYINAKKGIVIENNVQIGSHCSLYSISTIDNKEGKIIIKENAKICTHCTIMPGVIIGKNSIVGAHSFVTNDVPDNTLAYGVPARIIRKIQK